MQCKSRGEGSPFGGGTAISRLDVLSCAGPAWTGALGHASSCSTEQFCPGGVPLLESAHVAGPLILVQVADV